LSVFDDQFAVSAVPGLQDYFGESLTYKPRAGGSRTITGMVDRTDRSVYGELDRGTSTLLTIIVPNSATTGILSTEINTGGDQITVANRYGGTAIDRRIVRVVETNGSSVTIEVQ
jgi:hypothetical protein